MSMPQGSSLPVDGSLGQNVSPQLSMASLQDISAPINGYSTPSTSASTDNNPLQQDPASSENRPPFLNKSPTHNVASTTSLSDTQNTVSSQNGSLVQNTSSTANMPPQQSVASQSLSPPITGSPLNPLSGSNMPPPQNTLSPASLSMPPPPVPQNRSGSKRSIDDVYLGPDDVGSEPPQKKQAIVNAQASGSVQIPNQSQNSVNPPATRDVWDRNASLADNRSSRAQQKQARRPVLCSGVSDPNAASEYKACLQEMMAHAKGVVRAHAQNIAQSQPGTSSQLQLPVADNAAAAPNSGAQNQLDAHAQFIASGPYANSTYLSETGRKICGVSLEDAQLLPPRPLPQPEMDRRMMLIDHELFYQKKNVPILPPSSRAQQPPKEFVGATYRTPEGVEDPQLNAILEKKNRAILERAKQVDLERNNLAAKGTRTRRDEALTGFRRIANDLQVALNWWRTKAMTLGADPREWDQVPEAVKRTMTEDMDELVRKEDDIAAQRAKQQRSTLHSARNTENSKMLKEDTARKDQEVLKIWANLQAQRAAEAAGTTIVIDDHDAPNSSTHDNHQAPEAGIQPAQSVQYQINDFQNGQSLNSSDGDTSFDDGIFQNNGYQQVKNFQTIPSNKARANKARGKKTQNRKARHNLPQNNPLIENPLLESATQNQIHQNSPVQGSNVDNSVFEPQLLQFSTPQNNASQIHGPQPNDFQSNPYGDFLASNDLNSGLQAGEHDASGSQNNIIPAHEAQPDNFEASQYGHFLMNNDQNNGIQANEPQAFDPQSMNVQIDDFQHNGIQPGNIQAPGFQPNGIYPNNFPGDGLELLNYQDNNLASQQMYTNSFHSDFMANPFDASQMPAQDFQASGFQSQVSPSNDPGEFRMPDFLSSDSPYPELDDDTYGTGAGTGISKGDGNGNAFST
ncbi:hypothetical protein F66182_2132 [Fusarium sp. NRRL 66182]|nr:hypothetical protein F66182_2132 [Fusarium sp. NRRL 66182]